MDLEQRLGEDHSNETISKILTEGFKSVHDAFKVNVPNFEMSGTTCCAITMNGHRITSANVGDSRAILVNKQRQVTELTKDNKPDLVNEKKRILATGGRVDQIKTL